MTVHLYSGPLDGARRRIKKSARYLFVPGGTYTHSPEWSAHFRRPVLIPTHFKGQPALRLTREDRGLRMED